MVGQYKCKPVCFCQYNDEADEGCKRWIIVKKEKYQRIKRYGILWFRHRRRIKKCTEPEAETNDPNYKVLAEEAGFEELDEHFSLIVNSEW